MQNMCPLPRGCYHTYLASSLPPSCHGPSLPLFVLWSQPLHPLGEPAGPRSLRRQIHPRLPLLFAARCTLFLAAASSRIYLHPSTALAAVPLLRQEAKGGLEGLAFIQVTGTGPAGGRSSRPAQGTLADGQDAGVKHALGPVGAVDSMTLSASSGRAPNQSCGRRLGFRETRTRPMSARLLPAARAWSSHPRLGA